MKRLGRGWQYTVYDLGNGRVLKKYNSTLWAYLIPLRDCFPYIRHPLWKIPSYVRGCKETAQTSLLKVSQGRIEARFMGNPVLKGGLDYEQDKVEPLQDYFRRASVKESKDAIDSFVRLNYLLLEKGMIDKSFNICKNFGKNNNGEIIIIDLGELYSSEAAIRRQREKRAWAMPYVLYSLPKEVRVYFIEQMDKNFGV